MTIAGDIIALDSAPACDVAIAGAKASRLAHLKREGMNVPDGVVVVVAAFEKALASISDARQEIVLTTPLPSSLLQSLRIALARFGDDALAVRSSAVDEDLAGASFAGQYETVLDVHGVDAVAEAIARCWSSALAPRVRDYLAAHGITAPPRMAVLIQRLIAPEASGVAFTADALTGDRDVVTVNAVKGIGERLVSGAADANVWRIRGEAAEETVAADRAIEARLAVAVATLARRVEADAGSPQDIEWATRGGELFLLQARPITALPDAVTWRAPAPGLWLRMFRIGEWLGDPVTPLFETWLLDRLERRLHERFKEIADADEGPSHVVVNGWYFTSANFIPRSIAQALWIAVSRLLPAVLRHPRAMSVLTTGLAHHGMRFFEAVWRSGPAVRYAEAVSEATATLDRLEVQSGTSADGAAVARIVDSLADLAGDELFYFFVVGGSAWKAEAAFARFYDANVPGGTPGAHQDLLGGLGGGVLGAHAALSLDWFQPTAGELGLDGDGESDGGEARRADAAKRREIAVEHARGAMTSTRRRAKLDALLARAQHFGRVREEQAARLTLAWPVLRRCVRLLARPLVAAKSLSALDDAYFLTRDEMLSPGSVNVGVAGQRRAEWTRARRLVPPDHVGEMSGLRARILRSGPGAHPADAQSDGAVLRGVPASAGRAQGPARIIRSPLEFDRLKSGDVLVAPATSPAWTTLFGRAAAVVTDTGSAMAHASLVAREYGIPAVVGTGDATARLRDGQRIVVDGGRGTVSLAARGAK